MTKVAVYGSLRREMHNHPIIEGQAYLGTTVTTDEYTMYDLGAFPAVCLTIPVCPIVVEVYEVDDACMARLNRLEGYRGEGMDNFYDCSEIQTADFGPVLIYHMGPQRRTEMVTSGDWCKHYTYRQLSRNAS